MTRLRDAKGDLAGQRFGDLVCVAPTEERCSKGTTVWNCKCVCGRVVLRARRLLRDGAPYVCEHHPAKLRGEVYVDRPERCSEQQLLERHRG